MTNREYIEHLEHTIDLMEESCDYDRVCNDENLVKLHLEVTSRLYKITEELKKLL